MEARGQVAFVRGDASLRALLLLGDMQGREEEEGREEDGKDSENDARPALWHRRGLAATADVENNFLGCTNRLVATAGVLLGIDVVGDKRHPLWAKKRSCCPLD